ncbi:MAG: DNA-formamidopyrimidine glycosylase family protein [Aeromicrobium sp.]|uniref:DNA-formamidopyrimidine glycosylase family protein n=1 Tax=Aeromicrobium sp. TaxID=1871063 RepID=UPI0039E5D274
MPELPEVDALVADMSARLVGVTVAEAEVASFAVLKTFDPPADALRGLAVTGVRRHGKFVDVEVDGLHLVIHFAKAGWLRWVENFSDHPVKKGGPLALRVRIDRGDGPRGGFDVTEAGTRKGLAVYLVRDPQDVPGIAALGPEPLADGFTIRPLLGRRMQVKRLLRDQKILAGIGNAYSDEILHAARLSPFAIAATLDDDEIVRLDTAIREVLTDAVEHAHGKPAAELKDDKRTRMRVHGKAGEPCPVCAEVVAEVVFSDSSLQYCPACQTGGQLLKNRTTSKFVK